MEHPTSQARYVRVHESDEFEPAGSTAITILNNTPAATAPASSLDAPHHHHHHTTSPSSFPKPRTSTSSSSSSSSLRSARWCFFLLGAGLLSCWNALLTATDYFQALYPGYHTDRLFTVCYLPVCAAMVGLGIRYPHLLSPAARIRGGYAGFALAMAAVPLLDAVLMAPRTPHSANTNTTLTATTAITSTHLHHPSSILAASTPSPSLSSPSPPPPPAAPLWGLLAVCGAVVGVGLCDGLSQGALFGLVAQLPQGCMQALVSGTASSGVLVCLLRLGCKAAWSDGGGGGAGAADEGYDLAGLRNATRLYFGLAGLLSLSCLLVYDHLLPRLLASCDHHQGLLMQQQQQLGSCRTDEGTGELEQQQEPDATNKKDGGGGPKCDCSTAEEVAGHDDDGNDDDVDHPHLRSRAEQQPLLLPPLLSPQQQHQQHQQPQPQSPGLLKVELIPSREVLQKPLSTTHGSVGGSGPSPQCYHPPAAEVHAGSTNGSTSGSLTSPVLACLRRCWPACGCLGLTYSVTLAIFPGVLAEDVKSPQLGDWYPLLLLSAFNAADLLGKSLPPLAPPPTLAPAPALDDGRLREKEQQQQGERLLQPRRWPLRSMVVVEWEVLLRPLRRPMGLLAAAALRGVLALPAFLAAARGGGGAGVMAALTVALGVSNGFLTTQALTLGPATAVATTTSTTTTTTTTTSSNGGGSKRSAMHPRRNANAPAELLQEEEEEDEEEQKEEEEADAALQSTKDPLLPKPAAPPHPHPCSSSPYSHHPHPCSSSPYSHHPHPCSYPPSSHHPHPCSYPPSSHHPHPCSSSHSSHHPHPCSSHSPHPAAAEVVEQLLVLSMLLGLNAGAYLGWLWLL